MVANNLTTFEWTALFKDADPKQLQMAVEFFQDLEKASDLAEVRFGTGAPSFNAILGKRYWDISGNTMYINESDGGSSWVAV